MADKTIFISGCETGLGRSSALLFAQRGWRVLQQRSVIAPEEISNAARRSIDAGPVDIVFNTGYQLAGSLESMSDLELVRIFETNLLGVIRTTRAFLPYFRERRQGLFIAASSIGGLAARRLISIYRGTSWGIETWSDSMARELSQLGIGIKTIVPARLARHPTSDEVAAVAYEAATDGTDRRRYIVGEDRTTLHTQWSLGVEAFRIEVGARSTEMTRRRTVRN
jgi:NADP-dependent 3-hydroxy acid dehydrogenase YdfG